MFENNVRRLVLPVVLAICSGAIACSSGSRDVAEFYASFVPTEGAVEVAYYATIEEAVRDSTAVVTAEVVDVIHTRTIVAETDRLPMTGVVIRPTDVLVGELPAEDREELIVESIWGPGSDEDALTAMRKWLPDGEALWFLFNKGGEEAMYYRLSSSQGLVFQDGTKPVNARERDEVPRDMVDEVNGYETMAELEEYIRSLN